VEDIVGAIAGVVAPGQTLDAPSAVIDHVWSPSAYAPLVERALAGRTRQNPADDRADLGGRVALTDLRTEVLLAQNERISGELQRNLLSAPAHESAALLVGALALRESVGLFSDVRPALSRMAAHLSIARALRGSAEPSPDGRCALAILATLAGLERQAMQIVDAIEMRAPSDADRVWVRALRLRITGDWRAHTPSETDALLIQLEYARAIRARLGIDAFLDYLDTVPSQELTDWHRIAFDNASNVEAGNRFSRISVDRDLSEAAMAWSRLHGGRPIETAGLVAALNDRPASSPVTQARSGAVVQVADWGMWAAFEQRHLSTSLVSVSSSYWLRYQYEAQREWQRTSETQFGSLTLYPLVLRWGAPNADIYNRAMAGARAIVESAPELLTAAEWNYLLSKSNLQGADMTFPLDTAWFTPAVPEGTAFDLASRSLRAGCPRPPTKAQAAAWAREQPYEHWTVWANQYLALDSGKPSLDVIRRVFGSLTQYDEGALLKIIDYMDMTDRERVTFAGKLCEIAPGRCDRLGHLLLVSNREKEAVAAYERWITKARDTVGVSRGVTWIVRYYFSNGRRDRAEEIARLAADTGSAPGLEMLAEVLDRTGRFDQAESLYRRIDERYSDHSVPLGRFLMRQALRTGDKSLEAQAGELLRPVFPRGLEAVVMHALPVAPTDGVLLAPFGPRAMKTRLRATDVLIGVDGWRVHDYAQYQAVSRLAFDDRMVLTIWRDGRYQQLTATVPERWFATNFHTYRPPPQQ
jgi:tetratricopeptide (TPR) repeat protein